MQKNKLAILLLIYFLSNNFSYWTKKEEDTEGVERIAKEENFY
jgi:hypothetical protein